MTQRRQRDRSLDTLRTTPHYNSFIKLRQVSTYIVCGPTQGVVLKLIADRLASEWQEHDIVALTFDFRAESLEHEATITVEKVGKRL